jgi:hypothetical protein
MLEEGNDIRNFLKNNRPSFQLWEHAQLSASASHEVEESKHSEEEQSSLADSSHVTPEVK